MATRLLVITLQSMETSLTSEKIDIPTQLRLQPVPPVFRVLTLIETMATHSLMMIMDLQDRLVFVRTTTEAQALFLSQKPPPSKTF